MNRPLLRLVLSFTVSSCLFAVARADDPPADAGGAPKIFLDNSPAVVAYQLKRLTNPQLIALERKDSDPKYKPVYEAMLARAGFDRKYRQEAVEALAKLNKSDPVIEILTAIGKVDPSDKQTVRELVSMLMAQKPAALIAQREKIQSLATDSESNAVKQAAYATLATADGKPDAAWDFAQSNQGVAFMLGGIALINDPKLRGSFFSKVEPLARQAPDAQIQTAAIDALGSVSGHEAEAFKILTDIISSGQGNDRLTAVRAIRHIPDDKWPDAQIEGLASAVVKLIEQTPAAERTKPAVLQAIQLGDDLTGMLSEEKGAPLRKTLHELGVRVVAIRTLREQMAFDTRYFAVQAGKPVQIVLDNEDAMPHNLVITAPGAMQEVAVAGGQLPAPAEPTDLAYVPTTPKVITAMPLVQPDESATLSFTAPKEPGEYPFVCTFPGHWVRMYGVMLVVPDYDAWEKKPTFPKDPLTGKAIETAKTDPNSLQAHQH
ncbi:MAG TPA: plastocyanin/azurin family copper-binding protein [Humisphaera sp.]|jgi:azurin|nr:plastocyanin/azurin family copper-binding protein [Humisphaera sp.]